MTNQRGNLQLVIILVVLVVGLILGVYLVQQKTNLLPKAAPATPITQLDQTTSIKNDSDLMQASSDLDNENLNSIDSGLNENNSDATSF